MSRAQLPRLGMTRDEVRVRVRAGRFIPLYRGVIAALAQAAAARAPSASNSSVYGWSVAAATGS